MTTANLIKYTRARLGKILQNVDIDDNDITHAGDIIVTMLGEKFPKKVLRSITLVANTREYAVNSATIRVPEILSNTDVEEMNLRLGSPFTSEFGATEEYNFPSLWVIKQLRRRRALATIHHEFNPIEKKLKIDPTPRDANEGPLWYVSVESAGWTLATVPTDFAEMVEIGAAWKSLEIVALRRSTEGGIMREGGRVEYPAEALFRIAGGMKKEFEELLDIKQKLYF